MLCCGAGYTMLVVAAGSARLSLDSRALSAPLAHIHTTRPKIAIACVALEHRTLSWVPVVAVSAARCYARVASCATLRAALHAARCEVQTRPLRAQRSVRFGEVCTQVEAPPRVSVACLCGAVVATPLHIFYSFVPFVCSRVVLCRHRRARPSDTQTTQFILLICVRAWTAKSTRIVI